MSIQDLLAGRTSTHAERYHGARIEWGAINDPSWAPGVPIWAYRVKCKGTSTSPNDYWADVRPRPWFGHDFAYLGIVRTPHDPEGFPWAWFADGRSIDALDRAFDLVDFPLAENGEQSKPFFWLGAEALA